MRLRRRLCRLCECPALNGVVKVFDCDKGKFEEWCLDVMDANLADEFKRGDVICNSCVWDAEFLLNSRREGALQRFKWWPEPSINGSKTLVTGCLAAEKVNPCWVLLEKVSLPDNDAEGNERKRSKLEESVGNQLKMCIYCGRRLKDYYLKQHISVKHKNVAIRCEQYHCRMYFHTLDERKKHMEAAHDIPKERKPLLCIYCRRSLSNSSSLRTHISLVHADVQIKCRFHHCISYFHSQAELDSHYEFQHKKETKTFSCDNCEYKTKSKRTLQQHISLKHLARVLNCENCNRKFSTEHHLKNHVRAYHSFKKCSVCHLEMPLKYYGTHFKEKSCRRCNRKFLCCGSFDSHWETCRETAFECEKCKKSFKIRCKLDLHLKICQWNNYTWKGIEYKSSGFKCEPCRRYYCSAFHLKKHINGFQNLKSCAHCPKKFAKFISLDSHLATIHDLINCKYECQHCKKRFYTNATMTTHIKAVHDKPVELMRKCKICGKIVKLLAKHMLNIHGVKE